MFRRVEPLDPDAEYPADLKKLGFFLDTNGCFRHIEAPDYHFRYNHTNSQRHNDVRREAFRKCQLSEVHKRVSALGLTELYLPGLTQAKPDGPHVTILAPALSTLKMKKHLVVLIDDSNQELGVLSFRELGGQGGANGGSVANLAKEMVSRLPNLPNGIASKEALFKDGAGINADEDEQHVSGLVVLGTCQPLYSHKYNRNLSYTSWEALPRNSIYHHAPIMHDTENLVEGHRSAKEHIESVFDSLILNPDFVSAEAEIYVVAIEGGFQNFLNALGSEFERYTARIAALAIINSTVTSTDIQDPKMKAWLHARARHWSLANETTTDPTQCVELPADYQRPVGDIDASRTTRPADESFETSSMTPGSDKLNEDAKADRMFGPVCPIFSGGETSFGDVVFTQAAVQQAVLDFFDEVGRDARGFVNPQFEISPTKDEEEAVVTGAAGSTDPTMPNPYQLECTTMKEEIEHMKKALLVVSQDGTDITAGMEGLRKRIEKKEAELKKMEEQALGTGSLGPGEAEEVREEAETEAELSKEEGWGSGEEKPKVPFAGVMADSELVRKAGCHATVEEELAKLGLKSD